MFSSLLFFMKNGRHSGSVTPTGALHPKQPGLPTMDIRACVWPWVVEGREIPTRPIPHQPKSALGGGGDGKTISRSDASSAAALRKLPMQCPGNTALPSLASLPDGMQTKC